jgi:hypothetical protein
MVPPLLSSSTAAPRPCLGPQFLQLSPPHLPHLGVQIRPWIRNYRPTTPLLLLLLQHLALLLLLLPLRTCSSLSSALRISSSSRILRASSSYFLHASSYILRACSSCLACMNT